MYYDVITMQKSKESWYTAMVPTKTSWAENGLARDFPKAEYETILSNLYRFYVLNNFVPGLSSQSISLASYGWGRPWGDPEWLQRKLKDCCTNHKLYYSAESYDKIPQALQSAKLDDPIDEIDPYERACFYNSKRNQTLSLFSHIRNSFCHGRFASFGNKDSYWILMEDVAGNTKEEHGLVKLSARIVLRLDTLISWIDLIQKGPDNEEN